MLSSVIRILLVLPALTCTTARAEPLRPAAEQVGPLFATPLRVFDTAAAWLGTLSADGQSLAVAHVDGRVRLWDVASGRRRQVFEGASVWIDRLALNAQGQPLAISRDATLRRWDPETGDLLATQRLPVPTSPNRASPLAFSPDGRFVVNLDPPKLWDTETGRERLQLERVDAWAFSPDGGLWLNGAQLWDLATDRVLHTLGDPGKVWSVVFHPDGTQVLIGTEGAAQLWEAASGRLLHTFPAKGGVISAAFSPDGQRLLVQVSNGVDLWEKQAESGRWKRRASKIRGGPVAFSADGRFIRTVARIDDSEDQYTRLWDATTGRRVDSPLQSGALLSGRWLLSTLGGKIILWDAPGAEPLRTFPPGVGPESLEVSPDGRQALVRAADDGAWLWDLATGRPLHVKEGRFRQALTAGFTPDGPRLLTVNEASTVELWDLAAAPATPDAAGQVERHPLPVRRRPTPHRHRPPSGPRPTHRETHPAEARASHPPVVAGGRGWADRRPDRLRRRTPRAGRHRGPLRRPPAPLRCRRRRGLRGLAGPERPVGDPICRWPPAASR